MTFTKRSTKQSIGGKIIATHSKRRRRVEFLDFMNSVTAAFPNQKLHVILDNLNTHKKNEHWLKAHPNVQFHFTPTSASWLKVLADLGIYSIMKVMRFRYRAWALALQLLLAFDTLGRAAID